MLENLNPKQRAAVQTIDGPLLVLSGAGTGKTSVLTARVAHILNLGCAAPWQVLALTFTNKAAREMKNRIADIAAAGASWCAADLWCGTFHSICLRILRTNAAAAGLRSDFLVMGEDDQRAVVKTVLAARGASTKTPGDYVEQFSGIKDKGLSALDNADPVFRAYNDELARLNGIDFGDIILRVLVLFRDNPDILARYQRQFKYILVDEFQDTNDAQMQFLQMLTRDIAAPNICCVGDDDQSIYSWRGAQIKHILNFERTYPGARIIRLETNYRSTPNILGAANSLIRHNNDRLGKELCAANSNHAGEPVYVLTVPTDLDEVRVIANAITRDGGENYNDFAVLIRAGNLSRLFEEEFGRRGIPYRLVGATKFYDRMEIRDAIAYIRLMVYPFDDISFMRIIGRPRRGFGPAAIDKLRASGATLMDGLRNAPLGKSQRAAADAFLSAFDFNWADMAPRAAAQELLERVGYIKYWTDSADADAPDRLANIRELITGVVAKYDNMSDFLEQAALMMTDDDDDASRRDAPAVNVMTIHAAKGLEFNTVFMPAWEEGIFPNEKAIAEGALEEERRLAYVALTRARRRAIISNTMSRVVFGSRQYNAPSRFIAEMDDRYLDFQGGAPRNAYSAPRAAVAPRAPRPPKRMTMVGKLVAHDELGHGTVIAENGDVLTVAFGSRGMKNVMRDFVRVL